MKNENQIWEDIGVIIEAGLTANTITDFDVITANQPLKATIEDPTIWIDRISAKRFGWQGETERIDVDDAQHLDETYYQEIIFQITALKKRNPATDTALTMTSGDVINLLASYLNGRAGRAKLKEYSFCCIRVTDVREGVFMSDSDLYEKTPSFDLTLSHLQTDEKAATPTIVGYELTTEEI